MFDTIGSLAVRDGRIRRAGIPMPNSNRPIDILDIELAAIPEANVDPIANALVNDRGAARMAATFRFTRCLIMSPLRAFRPNDPHGNT
jgi:hypothetical protein